MTTGRQRTFREIGAPLAVFAAYVLVLLWPLHTSAALQRDLGKAGYETVSLWTICGDDGTDRSPDGNGKNLKCPAAGSSSIKFDATPPALLPVRQTAGIVVRAPARVVPAIRGTPGRTWFPRGPPAGALA